MAEKGEIYRVYCAIAINRLLEEGLIKSDADWYFKSGKHTFFLYNEAGRSKTVLVVNHDRDYRKITVTDDATQEEIKYDFVPEDIADRNRFAEVVVEFAKRKA